jgi:BirA family biotin operon repressor/biotin-[acetyl-CoA-carboxylase] ligase
MLKWPNDLWWFENPPAPGLPPAPNGVAGRLGRKLAGILIETVPMAAAVPDSARGAAPAGTRWVVVGVGVNVHTQGLAPEGLPTEGVAGTSQWRPHDAAPALWHLTAEAVARALVDFESQGFGPIREAVQAREALIGQDVTLSAGSVPQGRCVGLDQDGALLVQAPGGVHRVVAGEAQVRPVRPVPPARPV